MFEAEMGVGYRDCIARLILPGGAPLQFIHGFGKITGF